MGNKESEAAKELQVEINHPRLSRCKIVSREGEKVLQSSESVEEKEYERWRAALEKCKGAASGNLLLPRSHSFARAGLCGTTGTLLTTFENYPYLLLEEIYNRKGLKGRFAETELWFLLFSLVEARRQAAAVGERLGDVRPENIFLNEAGNIRVSNSLSWPLELTNLQKAFDKLPTYLAPEDLARLARGDTADAPSDAAEAFSIGLAVLSAGNLANYHHLYDLSSNELRLSALDEALSLWAHNAAYSEVLRGVVLLLLALSPEARLSCSELEELLRKHADHVVKKENFVVDNAPPKLHDQILTLRAILQQSILVQGAPSPLVASEYHLDFKKGPE